MNQPWQNRIVSYGEEAPDQLVASPSNWRVHNTFQQDSLLAVLETVGFVQDVIVSSRSGFILDGHLRVMLALRTGQTSIPVKYVDVTPDEERLILATLDPLSALASSDSQQLSDLLAECATDNPAIQELLASVAAGAGITLGLPEAGDGGDEFDATPAEGETRTSVGQLWALGDHRLLVGDCTVVGNVARLMDGKLAEMIWTDPPYGVAIGDKNKYLNTVGPSNRIEINLVGDTLDEAGLLVMLRAALGLAAEYCRAGGAWYVAAAPGPLHLLTGQVLRELDIWHQTIQWVKNNATFAPLGVDYHWRAEPLFYGWKPGAAHRYYGGRKQDTVWEIDRPMASPEHPTMKPVALVQRAIENSSRAGEIVYDPFLGSGTTIIAGQRTGRIVYGCELVPMYADVVLRRFTAESGIEPVLID